jgi:hypothetical protein
MRASYAIALFVLAGIGSSFAMEETIFGPTEYVRSESSPQVFEDTFETRATAGRLEIMNGSERGAYRVTSARVHFNDVEIFRPGDFGRKVGFLEAPVELLAENRITVELRDHRVGTYLLVRVNTDQPSFYEEVPGWSMPDLAVAGFTVTPDRADPGDGVQLRTTVVNRGLSATEPAEIVFLVDDDEVSRQPVPALDSLAEVEASVNWTAEGPGKHRVVAQVETTAFDRNGYNDLADDVVYLSGEPSPPIELEVEAHLDSLQLTAGAPVDIPITVRNPGFAGIVNLSLHYYLDGEMVSGEILEDLSPGGEQHLLVPWESVTPGQHVVEVWWSVPGLVFVIAGSWNINVPDSTVLNTQIGNGKWISLGPDYLFDGVDGLPTGSTGRIDHLAFHPTHKPTMYAGAPTGGVWKTTDGGVSWKPLTDHLPSMNVGSLAVDPNHPDVIYMGTGSSVFDGGMGIFKSIDGGATWSATPFAREVDLPFIGVKQIAGVSKIVIRYPDPAQPNKVLIYAATDLGVLRYESTNPLATTSTASEWTLIRTGRIFDIIVSPTDNSVIYVSIMDKGLYKTTKGEVTHVDTDWSRLLPVPASAGGRWYTFDIHWGSPKVIWAAIKDWSADIRLAVYRSVTDGAVWHGVHAYKFDGMYNALIRVNPADATEILMGGVKLYIPLKKFPKWVGTRKWIHDDMQGFEYDPREPGTAYVLTDGGIWKLTDAGWTVGLNHELRVTMYYDMSTSSSDPNLMIGGTQDCGTLLYFGRDDWQIIKGGDGCYTAIGPGDDKFYAQHQFLRDTKMCDEGDDCEVGEWSKASSGLPGSDDWGCSRGTSQIAVHPQYDNELVSQGDQVYFTNDSGGKWLSVGPRPSDGLEGKVSRVAFQPTTDAIVAGTNTGQVWIGTGYLWWRTWHLLFTDPEKRNIRSLAFSSVDHEVLYVTTPGGDPTRRLWQLRITGSPPTAPGLYATGNFPQNLDARVIAGDAHKTHVAFVGTQKGVYRGEAPYEGGKWTWAPYNDGFPLVEVTDLIVDPTSKELRAATYGRGAWAVITGP